VFGGEKSKSRTTVAFRRSQKLGMSVNAVGGDVCRMREEDVPDCSCV
jgi:hypothetical protein